MSPFRKSVLCICVLVSVAVLPCGLIGGPLDPSGPPAPTMKPLDVVEPRTAITSLPFTISSAGSYYLAGNLSLSAGIGITIQVSNVTLDLNGFELKGNSSGSYAIISSSSTKNIVIKNGLITGWQSSGIYGGNTEGLQVSNVTADGNGNYGIRAGVGAVITDCHVSNTVSGAGITVNANSVVSNCTARNNNGYGFSLVSSNARSCVSIGNVDSFGYYLQHSQAIDCTAKANSKGFYVRDGSEVINSIAEGNVDGISTYLDGNRVDGNLVINNSQRGIYTASGVSFIVRNIAHGNAINYSISSGNSSGQIITGSHGMTGTNPWANFQF